VLEKYGRSFQGFNPETWKRKNVKFLGVDAKIWEILEIYDVRMLNRFSWFKIGYSSGLL
jgi:hypothetical protein